MTHNPHVYILVIYLKGQIIVQYINNESDFDHPKIVNERRYFFRYLVIELHFDFFELNKLNTDYNIQ